MATDYDAPHRRVEDELETDSLEGLKAAEGENNGMDDDGEIVEPFEPPTVDLTGEELNVTVVPRREDEFTCSSCLLDCTIKHDEQVNSSSPLFHAVKTNLPVRRALSCTPKSDFPTWKTVSRSASIALKRCFLHESGGHPEIWVAATFCFDLEPRLLDL